ncbi:MAG: ABC transporter ATP-binding protein [Lachnospiraceae bacterium]|nr:ABC transporter ATP-binding protein [Lachnospiraceae bacterium]
MSKIFKNLWEHKGAVIAIIGLLLVQAFCDLALPSYTSKIVDVGIQQDGIEDAVMMSMREETFHDLMRQIKDKNQQSMFQSAYEKTEQSTYELKKVDRDTRTELNTVITNAVLMLSGSDDNRKESMATQRAILFVKGEYESMGIPMGDYQISYLLRTGGKMLLLTIGMILDAVLVGLLASKVAAKIGMNLRSRVFKKVISFSNSELDKFSTASLITRSTNDIQQIQMVSVMLLRMVLYAPILGIGGIIMVLRTKTGMSFIIGIAVFCILALIGILLRIAMPKFKSMQVLMDRLNLVSREIITGLSVIRAFSREKEEEVRFEKANRDLMKTQLFTNRVMSFMMPAMMLIMNGITLLIVWFGSKGVDMGRMQVGDMMAFIMYAMMIIMSFLMLSMISVMLPRAGVAADRIDEVLKTETTIFDPKTEKKDNLAECKGVLAFENVSFCYPGADEDALKDISFLAEPGKTTAVIGSTGCGKSTLVHLIPRLYDVTSGRITLDGIDIRELSQKKLRSSLGFVPQKGVLFSGTISSNIKYGDESITESRMKRASSIAQAEEFIISKEEGYESKISQGGSNVSGGQKQRLSIARAIAKEPKVFLFDDSFSALDYKTDADLRKALKQEISDATVIIVAQRISTIMQADQIIVLEEGRIVGKGTHEELLNSCEAYMEIARTQLSETELNGGIVG